MQGNAHMTRVSYKQFFAMLIVTVISNQMGYSFYLKIIANYNKNRNILMNFINE